MSKQDRSKKHRPAPRPSAPQAPALSPEAQEVRALLRRIPDGQQAALNALANRLAPHRERVLTELARGLGKEILPLLRAAALAPQEELAQAAVRVLPVLGTRAAADVLGEVYQAGPETERGRLAGRGALALQARGIHVSIPDLPAEEDAPRFHLRETYASAPDGAGSRSIAARFQDEYGVWHACMLLWNDQAGVKDGFMRPFSRQEWEERVERLEARASSPTACPPDYARWQVSEARKLNERTGFPLGDHLKDWDTYVGDPPGDYVPPDPTAPVRVLPEEERARAFRESMGLFTLPPVHSWFLEAGDCGQWPRRWLDFQNRVRLRGASEVLQEEGGRLVRAAAEDVIGEELQALYRNRLLDLGRVCEWRHQPVLARRAAAAALAIQEGVPVGENPFFLELTQRTLTAAEALLRRGEDLERLRYRPMKRL